jgi:PAS domain-containing protein
MATDDRDLVSGEAWTHYCSRLLNKENPIELWALKSCANCGAERPRVALKLNKPEYDYVDSERKWTRRGIQQLIRMELEALGLIPGKDGRDLTTTPAPRPAPDGHYWDGSRWVDISGESHTDMFLRWAPLVLNTNFTDDEQRAIRAWFQSISDSTTHPIIDWDRIDHFRVFFNGAWIAVPNYHVEAIKKD